MTGHSTGKLRLILEYFVGAVTVYALRSWFCGMKSLPVASNCSIWPFQIGHLIECVRVHSTRIVNPNNPVPIMNSKIQPKNRRVKTEQEIEYNRMSVNALAQANRTMINTSKSKSRSQRAKKCIHYESPFSLGNTTYLH